MFVPLSASMGGPFAATAASEPFSLLVLKGVESSAASDSAFPALDSSGSFAFVATSRGSSMVFDGVRFEESQTIFLAATRKINHTHQ